MLARNVTRQCHTLLQRPVNSGKRLLHRHHGAASGSSPRIVGPARCAFGDDPHTHPLRRRELSSRLPSSTLPCTLPHSRTSIGIDCYARVWSRPFTTDSNENVVTDAGTGASSAAPSPVSKAPATKNAEQDAKQTQSASKPSFQQIQNNDVIGEKPVTGKNAQVKTGDSEEESSFSSIPTKKSSPDPSAEQNKLFIIQLQDIQDKLQQVAIDAQLLSQRSKTLGDRLEMVNCADEFKLLLNAPVLDKTVRALKKYNKLKNKQSEAQQELKKETASQIKLESELEEMFAQAAKSMHALHRSILAVVESCVPPKPSLEDHGFNMEKYSILTVGRALQLTQRAEELGMPLHLPLYQRVAMGMVLTSPPPPQSLQAKKDTPNQQESAVDKSEDETLSTDDTNSITPLVLPGQFQQIKEGLHTHPLSMELIDLCNRVVAAHHIPVNRREDFVHDILAEPFLQLLRQKQWEVALMVVRSWESQFVADSGTEGNDDLLTLLGEEKTLEALEIAKSWLNLSVPGKPTFETDVQLNPHANELISILQVCLAKILNNRKERAEYMGQVLSNVISIIQSTDDGNDEGIDGEDLDYDDDDFGSDSDEEEDDWSIATADDGEHLSLGTVADANFAGLSERNKPDALAAATGNNKSNDVIKSGDGIPGTISFDAKLKTNQEDDDDDDDELPIMEGYDNKFARERIYLRNSGEWVMPDIVGQLEDWNKGNPLSFTPEFERYLGRQMLKYDEEDEDGWD